MSAIDAAGPAYSYDALFPALPESFPSFMSNSASTNMTRVESSVVTQVNIYNQRTSLLYRFVIPRIMFSTGFLYSIRRTKNRFGEIR